MAIFTVTALYQAPHSFHFILLMIFFRWHLFASNWRVWLLHFWWKSDNNHDTIRSQFQRCSFRIYLHTFSLSLCACVFWLCDYVNFYILLNCSLIIRCHRFGVLNVQFLVLLNFVLFRKNEIWNVRKRNETCKKYKKKMPSTGECQIK